MSTKNIVLIHGLWMTSLSWEHWKKRFSEQGFNVLIPEWPGMEGKSVSEIRKEPDFMRGLGVEEISAYVEKQIRAAFDTHPIIMGHSFGGLITQLLLNKGLGCAGVAIHSAQTKGVLRIPFTTIKSAWSGLKNPFDINGLAEMSFDDFNYAFTNGMDIRLARAAYNRYYIPAPKRPLIQAAFANFYSDAVTKVNYRNESRPPLLFVGGGIDHITPPSVNRENAMNYHAKTVTDYFEFSDRNHYTAGQPGWESVADYSLRWALEQSKGFEESVNYL